ncbi:MAG: pseudouridine synthase [Patescibacteria group bacterium]|jgi:23S rRNA pseudouridine2605 synthase
MPPIRLQKFLSQAGVCSRREAEVLIEQDAVKINGQIAKLGDRVDEETDQVTVKGKTIAAGGEKIYLLFNKPAGFVCTRAEHHTEKNIYDLLPLELKTRVWPVGRLDKNSCGLLILTNDGELTQKLTHPKYRHEKEYHAKFTGEFNTSAERYLSAGIDTEKIQTLPCQITVITPNEIKIILREGQKRQVREMLRAVGCQVTWLERVREGKLLLGDLPVGRFEYIRKEDII